MTSDARRGGSARFAALPAYVRFGCVAVVLRLAAAVAAGQDDARPAAAGGSLTDRQQAVRERLQRLEGRMLQLVRLLAENEPDKVERLRDALDRAGEQQLKTRIETLVALLRESKFDDAGQGQQEMLRDLESLLELLTSTQTDVDRRRAERQRLEEIRKQVRDLLERQNEHLQRTEALEKELGQGANAKPGEEGKTAESQPADPEAVEQARRGLRQLEEEQREAQRAASALARRMQEKNAEGRTTPGSPQAGRAADAMREAADRLGEMQPDAAEEQQKEAIEQLQQAMNQLEDALRQVRREEMEETLTALEVRFRSMLEREKQVRAAVETLAARGSQPFTRLEEAQLTDSRETQQQVTADCEASGRILRDEGSTVILPEIVTQLATDMRAVADRLAEPDLARPTQQQLDGVIATLEEILGAIDAKREQEIAAGQQAGQQSGQQQQALLPGSAELKLLRSAQVRLLARTGELNGAAVQPDAKAELESIARRQVQLSEMARRMHERD